MLIRRRNDAVQGAGHCLLEDVLEAALARRNRVRRPARRVRGVQRRDRQRAHLGRVLAHGVFQRVAFDAPPRLEQWPVTIFRIARGGIVPLDTG